MLTPEQALKQNEELLKEIKKADKSYVEVGILADSATSKVYKSGITVLAVAAIHEFGLGNNPIRSWLRAPQEAKKKDIEKFIAREFKKVVEDGEDVKKALGRVGAFVSNISKGAFTSDGYGTWAPLEAETIKRKGSSKILIDKGTLRRAISWNVVEN
jgi:phage gpG-like protein